MRRTTSDSAVASAPVLYNAWGGVQSGSSALTLFGFTGELERGGLTYLRARWYNPSRAGFVSRDSYAGDEQTPYSFNPYQYGYSNPVNATDPTGMYAWDRTCSIGAGGAGSCSAADYAYWWGSDNGWGTDAEPGSFHRFINALPRATWNVTGGTVADLAVLGWAFLHQPDAVTLGVIQGIRDSPAALRRQASDMLCGDPDALAGFVMGYGTFVLGNLAGPSLGRYARAGGVLDTVVDDTRFLPIADDMVPCVNSFSADTPVATAAGTVSIANIRIGDVVRGYDETTSTTGLFTVTAVISHTDPLVLDLTLDDETLTTTPEHPFYAMLRGWTHAADLRLGDSVRRLDGTYGRVNNTAIVTEPRVMYNLTVATAHTFFVGEEAWLVHNANCNALRLGKEVEASALGLKLAQTADNILATRIPRNMRKSVTIAVSEVDGEQVIAINSGVDPQVVQHLRSLGIDPIYEPSLGSAKEGHAERVLYRKYDTSVKSIGISHWRGPCQNGEGNCRTFFESVDVELTWTGIFK